ncbi:replication endonuclease, partial [Roseateles violae]
MTGIAEGLAGLANPALRALKGADWITPAERWQQRQQARTAAASAKRARTLDEIARVRLDRITAPVDPYASDRDLAELAERRAGFMLDLIADLAEPVTRDWLSAQVEALEARPLPELVCGASVADQLAGLVKRVTCAAWWRRQVRRAAVRRREDEAQRRGAISVRTSQPYVTDETVRRRLAQLARNRAMLEATELESADGEIITLWQAVESSTANLAIRRGELMTRIRGAEEWATACGMVGLFTTNTLPSRFHAQHFKGGRNAAYDDSTPRDGQRWLCKTWARVRARIKRQGLRVFGFRVAEPHHDGCPHWHMLLWADPEHLPALQAALREHWLAEDGDEPGAQEHRVKFESIDPARGGAVSYVAKYIAKNIDDAGAVGAEGHRDERDGQVEFIEGGNKAQRVMAWAAAHGIRQFQAIGQPPVTVWRELRRVDASAAQGASDALRAAHAAVNRDEGRRACWRAYMQAQGGAMTGRGYRLRVMTEQREIQGRYGRSVKDWPLGLYDAKRPDEVVPSERKAWMPRGQWPADQRKAALEPEAELRAFMREGLGLSARPQAAQPWTRVINCTRRGGAAYLMNSGIAALSKGKESPGG